MIVPMRVESGTVLVVIFGSITIVFLIIPFGVVLAKLPALWRTDPVMGAVITGVVLLNGLLFAWFLMIAGIIGFHGG